MWPRLGSIALGVWLVVAPAALLYGDPGKTHDRIVGPLVTAVAMVAMSEVTRALRWINVAIGAWLIVAPFVLGFGPTPSANSLVVGVLLALFSARRGRMTQRYAGGWSALLRSAPSATDRS